MSLLVKMFLFDGDSNLPWAYELPLQLLAVLQLAGTFEGVYPVNESVLYMRVDVLPLPLFF